jgi:type II secretory pathway component PulF
VLAYIAIIIAFTGVLQVIWWLAIIGVVMLVALLGVVVKREFFDDNTPDYYDYND